jgi:hypothetical protein
MVTVDKISTLKKVNADYSVTSVYADCKISAIDSEYGLLPHKTNRKIIYCCEND